jgi:hypothetical protein
MKSRDGKSQRREEKRRKEQRRSQKIEDGGARKKVGKSQNTAFFQRFVAPEGRKVGSLKPAGQMRGEKLHTVVARSTFPSQNVQNTSALEHF